MVLDMVEFEVILDMDWLASCHATLDCRLKAIKFSFPGEATFIIQGDCSKTLISVLSAGRLLRKGCHVFLALVRDVDSLVAGLKHVPVVSEFTDVFNKELPGLPPDKEIEFSIDVVPGTYPISISITRT